jgi:hypothetical protein
VSVECTGDAYLARSIDQFDGARAASPVGNACRFRTSSRANEKYTDDDEVPRLHRGEAEAVWPIPPTPPFTSGGKDGRMGATKSLLWRSTRQSRLPQICARPASPSRNNTRRLDLAIRAIFALWVLGGSASLAADPDHWAFIPPQRSNVPRVNELSWLRNPIDAFVLAALEESGLPHAAEADRATLLRRLSFDLTGLPPLPGEVNAFVADRSALAYERLVDRLLNSPEYGERWGQHWLDLARFAETDGFEFDQARPEAWRYRDWVVRALNRDLPYDAFVRLQLAGDEVQPGDPAAFIATGFNRCYPDMVDLNDQGLRRQNALNDITETTGLIFLGLTIGCARCHDHKFDPIRQTDFYALQAFFTPVRFRDDYPLASASDRREYEDQTRRWEHQVAAVRRRLICLEAPWRDLLAPGDPPGINDETAAAFGKTPEDRSPREVELVFESLARDKRIRSATWQIVLDPINAHLRRVLMNRLARLKLSGPRALPKARGVDETGPNAPPTYLLRRGEYGARGPEVAPAFPAVLCESDARAAARPGPSARSTGRRTALADWLLRPDHPLTARVIVNRLWQHHFGRGLVGTPSDFGTMGDEPTHSELLDWLATELIARGWSLKSMHRLIVTSAVYRQASRAGGPGRTTDPENLLLWRQNRQRLDGEAIRDSLLAVSGRLNKSMGGPSVFPELPPELSRLSSKGAVWPVSPRVEDRQRRSLYVFVRRNLRYPFFEVFDRPDTNASCPQRPVTTIAPQALSMLNSPLAHDAARALAKRIAVEVTRDRVGEIDRICLLVFGQPADAVERKMISDFLARGGALEHLCLALLNSNAFVYVD